MMKDIRQYIDKVLGSSIRCLLPSYWWKRIFGLIVDEVEDVRKVANSKANKSVVDDVKEVSLRIDEVSTKVDEMVSYILYAPISTLTDEQKAHNAEVFRTIGLKNKPYELEVYFVSGSTLYKVALNGFNRQSTQIEIVCSHPLSPSPFGVQMKAVFVSDGSCTTEPLRPDAELNAGSLSAIQNKVVTNALATKQDTISDLDAIRSGAAKGATAIQSVKTINGQSIIGEGDITIEGGESYDDTEVKEDISALKQEVGKRNVGAEDTDESVEEPEDKYASIEFVNTKIANAITNELNADF